MHIVRTIAWIILTAIVVAFVVANWTAPLEVRLWPQSDADGGWYVVGWPVGFIALAFLLVGFIPMWLYHRAAKWQLKRRIATLEAAARSAIQPTPSSGPTPAAPPAEPAPAPETPQSTPTAGAPQP